MASPPLALHPVAPVEEAEDQGTKAAGTRTGPLPGLEISGEWSWAVVECWREPHARRRAQPLSGNLRSR